MLRPAYVEIFADFVEACRRRHLHKMGVSLAALFSQMGSLDTRTQTVETDERWPIHVRIDVGPSADAPNRLRVDLRFEE